MYFRSAGSPLCSNHWHSLFPNTIKSYAQRPRTELRSHLRHMISGPTERAQLVSTCRDTASQPLMTFFFCGLRKLLPSFIRYDIYPRRANECIQRTHLTHRALFHIVVPYLRKGFFIFLKGILRTIVLPYGCRLVEVDEGRSISSLGQLQRG